MTFVIHNFGNGHQASQITTPGEFEYIGVNGHSTFDVTVADHSEAFVNIAALGQWVGGYDVHSGGTGVAFGGHWDNTISTVDLGGRLFVQSQLAGAGRFDNLGSLTFLAPQHDASETVITEGGTTDYRPGTSGKMFNVLVNGKIELDGVRADSFKITNNDLQLFNHDKVVAALNVEVFKLFPNLQLGAFGVRQEGGNVVIHNGFSADDHTGTLLGLHA
jgi:hypothetical protein